VRPKHRQRQFVVHVLEGHLQGHPDARLIFAALDEIAYQPQVRLLVELDYR
jgi:hypothetical protein